MIYRHGLEDVRNEDFYFLAEGLFERAEPMYVSLRLYSTITDINTGTTM